MVQNPSAVLTILAVLVRAVFGFRLIVDAHNAAIIPFVRPRWLIARVSRWLVRKADLTIVTNRQLADLVRKQRGKPFVLPDRVPIPPPVSGTRQRRQFTVALVAAFAADEPIDEVFEAVRETDIEVYVTGDYRRMSRDTAERAPKNVHLCGFLADADYWALLSSVDGVVDLTRTPHCLVCGAYEALAVGKPMLLSRSVASMELFGDCALFTDNTPRDIRLALERLRDESVSLQAAAVSTRRRLGDSWNALAQELRHTVASWTATGN